MSLLYSLIFLLILAKVAVAQYRIVGGTKANIAQFPWQVIIKEYKEDPVRGGGSIISATWVLTAGHVTYGLQSVYLVFGTIYLNDTSALAMEANDLIIHPDYNDTYLHNDISFIKLPNPLTFSDTIKPIALVQSVENLFLGTVATIAGWGITNDTILIRSNDLLWAEVTIVDNYYCKTVFEAGFVQSSNICAKGYSSSDASTCVSDSGGPLIIRDDNGNWMQIGINSFVANEACTEGYPSGYVRLSSYLTYIESVTGIGSTK